MAGNSDYAIVGGGPAGVAAAYVLGKKGFKVTLYDSAHRLGIKPCGRGIPATGDIPLTIPRESIIREIKGASLYVDWTKVFDIEKGLRGVIVDKSLMLESLLAEAGVDWIGNAVYKPGRREVRIGGRYREVKDGLFAGGHVYYEGETINAIQYRLRGRQFEDLDKLIIYFDTKLIGYYYIFPNADNEADVGVGGYASFQELKERLDKFIKSNDYLKDIEILRLEGAKIAVGGVIHKQLDGLEVIGEAAGYVLPLTGEGIRPSMLSGIAAAKAIIDGVNVRKALSKIPITKAIQFQRRILDKVKNMAPSKRADLLKSLPPQAHAIVALGHISKTALMKVLADKPSLLVKLLTIL